MKGDSFKHFGDLPSLSLFSVVFDKQLQLYSVRIRVDCEDVKDFPIAWTLEASTAAEILLKIRNTKFWQKNSEYLPGCKEFPSCHSVQISCNGEFGTFIFVSTSQFEAASRMLKIWSKNLNFTRRVGEYLGDQP